MRQAVAERARLCVALGPHGPQAAKTLMRLGTANPTDDPLLAPSARLLARYYHLLFLRRHFCRLDPWPAPLMESTINREVFACLKGANSFAVTGRLRDWDIVERLGEITVPTLLTSGRHDYATPALVETVHRGIPGSEWCLFEHSAHMAHLEEPEQYMHVLDRFLTRVEATAEP
jgi:proline-specific peptidase